jgi:hypothetical protein
MFSYSCRKVPIINTKMSKKERGLTKVPNAHSVGNTKSHTVTLHVDYSHYSTTHCHPGRRKLGSLAHSGCELMMLYLNFLVSRWHHRLQLTRFGTSSQRFHCRDGRTFEDQRRVVHHQYKYQHHWLLHCWCNQIHFR